MSSPSTLQIPALLLQSKTALHRGQALCTRANDLSIASTSLAVDALALDAKVRWMTDGVLEQLKVATDIAKSLSSKRAKLQEEIRRWDIHRDESTESLDSQLDRLSHVLVPPTMHEPPLRSLGGEQETVDPFGEAEANGVNVNVNGSGVQREESDRKKWRSLRDFVSEQEVDDVMEKMEADRTVLDDVLSSPDIPTPQALLRSISHIRSSLPARSPPLTPQIHTLLSQQEETTTTMSIQLESMTAHFEQMVQAEGEEREGIEISGEDLDVLLRDTQELQPILEELEQGVGAIAAFNDQLKEMSESSKTSLPALDTALHSLESIFLSMSEVSNRLTVIEESTATILPLLNAHLAIVASLQEHFRQVELAYHGLVVELDRRRAARKRAEAIIAEMQAKLDAWRIEEMGHRDQFMSTAGEWLPESLCPSMADAPEEWDVQRVGDERGDVLLESDLDMAALREGGR